VPIAVGETFERYEIESLLGRGGMGEVYRAVDTRLRRKVALKVLRPDRGSEDAVARLFREARAAAVLTHPNTVAIHDIGESEGIFYIVMELVTGASLLAYVGDARVPAARKLGWLVDVARALSAAHKSGVVHRDVKPSNVMVSDDGVVKVLDFGLAKPLAPVSFRTQQGHVLGTPRYMAPEQLAGADVDARSDQYAFGLTAYELVAGTHPGGALAPRVSPPLDEVVPEVSRGVARVVARAMATDPAQRYASMDDVAVALEDALAGRRERGVVMGDPREAREPSEVTQVEAPETEAPITDTVRFADVVAQGSAVTTKRAGGAGVAVVANIDILPAGAGSPAKPPPASTAAPSDVDLEAGQATQTARSLAAAQESLPDDEPKAQPQDARPQPQTLMSREAPPLPQPLTKTLLAAGNVAPAEVAPPAEIVAAPRKKSANAAAKAPSSANAGATPSASDRDALEATGPRAPPGVAASSIAKPRRTPTLLVALLVLGACAFAGAYFGSKELARRDLANAGATSSSAVTPSATPAALPGSATFSPPPPTATPRPRER
jgi:serine/threonine-protein kinase